MAAMTPRPRPASRWRRRARAAARSAVPLRRHRPLHDAAAAARSSGDLGSDPRLRRRCGRRSSRRSANVVDRACVSAIVVGVVARRAAPSLAARCARRSIRCSPTYYAIPVFAFYPLFIVIFGLGDLPQVLIGFMLGRGRRDREHAQRPRPRAARAAARPRASIASAPVATALQGHAALRGAVHLHRRQARGRLFVHRRDRRRVHHVAQRASATRSASPTTISTTP